VTLSGKELKLTTQQELQQVLLLDVRKYDTYNSGWVDTKGAAALATYIAANTEYPPLNLPWVRR
jgi:hypothetical protein